VASVDVGMAYDAAWAVACSLHMASPASDTINRLHTPHHRHCSTSAGAYVRLDSPASVWSLTCVILFDFTGKYLGSSKGRRARDGHEMGGNEREHARQRYE